MMPSLPDIPRTCIITPIAYSSAAKHNMGNPRWLSRGLPRTMERPRALDGTLQNADTSSLRRRWLTVTGGRSKLVGNGNAGNGNAGNGNGHEPEGTGG